jgi:hypothetical protein
MSVSWLSDAEAEEYERAALASYDTDPPDACDFSPPCAWCGDITNVREVRLSASLDGSGIYGWSRTGRGECSCGERSPVLESNAARKRWHREHKAEVSS